MVETHFLKAACVIRRPLVLCFLCDLSFEVNTDRRFQRFAECALPLATEVAKSALREVGVRPSDVGKIVVVTSTGVSVFFLFVFCRFFGQGGVFCFCFFHEVHVNILRA